VKQSRGSIALESTPGVGTSIAMALPGPSGRDAPAPLRDREVADVPVGLRVLLVEDDAEVRAVMCKFLQTLGCTVQAVSSAEQALVSLDAGLDVELLLTDIALGTGMRGTALAREVQRRHPAMHILLMSGFSSELIAADRDSPSSWELLPKPCTREELAHAIARVIRHGPQTG